jgi:CPA1 family monovalent cation:H+ antiporter
LSAIRQRRRGVERSSWRVPAVVSWAGTRGVVPLAAALSIPLTTSSGTALPDRDLVLLLTIAVIVITLVVQGFTLAPLVRRAGIALTAGDVRQEHTCARLRLARAGLSHLDHVTETETAPEFVIEQLRNSWQNRIERIKEHDNGEPSATASIYRRLRRDLLAVESTELDRLYRTNAITDATRRRIQRLLDLEHAGLGEDEP